MKNTCVDISGKLNTGLVELYKDINDTAKLLNIPYLVIGAMARDLVLVHGFNSKIERGTRDVDFGINIESWEQFFLLQSALLNIGFVQDKNSIHKFTRTDHHNLPWEIDIVPFGKIVDQQSSIHWPPEGAFVMNVIGFNEALQNALQVTISKNPKLTISVASPAGTALLKLIAWFDRESEFRKKDASDIKYLIATYHKIPEIFDAIYDEGFAEEQDYDVLKASAAKLGTDINHISPPKIKRLLQDNIFLNETNMIEFSREMNSGINTDFDENFELLTLLGQGILKEK